MKHTTVIRPDLDELCQTMAEELLRLTRQAADQGRDFTLFLTGGSTPKPLYQLLAKPPFSNAMPWGKIKIFFGDERCVQPDSIDSNYAMANNAMLKHISIDPRNIHRIQGELSPANAAEAYNNTLKYALPQTDDGMVTPDLVLLGLGPDGHIASLFPDTDILEEQDKFVSDVWVEKLKTSRISITYPVINNAKHVWLFVSGEGKQDIVDRIFNHPSHTDLLPIERLAPKGDLLWFLDKDASRWIKP